MSAKIIDGLKIATQVKNHVVKEVIELQKKNIFPALAVVLVGDSPASVSYVKGKTRALNEVGMKDKTFYLPENSTQEEVLNLIRDLNNDDLITGILVQLPVPKQISPKEIISAIDPKKDVDGFHPMNIGAMFLGHESYVPCTPQGIVYLLNKENIKTSGRHAVIIGRSAIVGKPLATLLLDKDINCTVTICHKSTVNLSKITRLADILIVAIGDPLFVKADMVKEGAVVIDVGVNRVEDSSKKSGFRLVGDVDFDDVKEIASAITPVPKGVGPMTIAMLMENTLVAVKRQHNLI